VTNGVETDVIPFLCYCFLAYLFIKKDGSLFSFFVDCCCFVDGSY